jgi:predicted site-specific integrase-resolvase
MQLRAAPHRIIAYCRVSSPAQKPDLRNQRGVLEEFCAARGLAGVEFNEEIGGGLNFKRRYLLELSDAIGRGEVRTLVLAHRDRLTRFGYEWFEHMAHQHGCEVLVLNQERLSPEQEMAQDMMTIVDCFSSRLDGLRNYRRQQNAALNQEALGQRPNAMVLKKQFNAIKYIHPDWLDDEGKRGCKQSIAMRTHSRLPTSRRPGVAIAGRAGPTSKLADRFSKRRDAAGIRSTLPMTSFGLRAKTSRCPRLDKSCSLRPSGSQAKSWAPMCRVKPITGMWPYRSSYRNKRRISSAAVPAWLASTLA